MHVVMSSFSMSNIQQGMSNRRSFARRDALFLNIEPQNTKHRMSKDAQRTPRTSQPMIPNMLSATRYTLRDFII